jgi:hypothetical protein
MCDNLDNNVAALLVSNLGNGDTIALCPPCIPMWAQAILTEFTIPSDAEPAEAATTDTTPPPEGVPAGAPFRVVAEAESAEAEAQRPDGEGPPTPADDAAAD